MLLLLGDRLYGRIEKCDGACKATRFFHLFFMPLVPMGTQIVLSESGGKSVTNVSVPLFGGISHDSTDYVAVPTRLSLKSVLLGYARTWCALPLMLSSLFLLFGLGDLEHPALLKVTGPVFAVVVLVFVALMLAGRLTKEQISHRRVYANHVGAAVDPADLREGAPKLREQLLRLMPPNWERVVLDPATRDQELLIAAMTLSRVEGSLDPSLRVRMGVIHRTVWARLRSQ